MQPDLDPARLCAIPRRVRPRLRQGLRSCRTPADGPRSGWRAASGSGSYDGPFGTDHDLSAPSNSSPSLRALPSFFYLGRARPYVQHAARPEEVFAPPAASSVVVHVHVDLDDAAVCEEDMTGVGWIDGQLAAPGAQA